MVTEHAIILAAGKGSRLLPITEQIPKCLIEIQGRSILENALANLASAGVKHAVIVVGYLAGMVQQRIGNEFCGMAVTYVRNPEYATTNNMVSLLLGIRACGAPAWIVESDIFFDPEILRSPPGDAEIVWHVDSGRRDLDGAFIIAGPDGRATGLEIIRDLTLLEKKHHKSVGILHVNGSGLQKMERWLNEGIRENKANLFYDLILAQHVSEIAIRIAGVGKSRWFEIDTEDDLNTAQEIFRKKNGRKNP